MCACIMASINSSMQVVVVVPSPTDLAVVGAVACPACGKLVANSGALRIHQKQVHARESSSNNSCTSIINSSSSSDMTSHVRFKYYCPVRDCSRSVAHDLPFSRMGEVRQHWGTRHAAKTLECSRCSKRFGLADVHRRHEACCGLLFACSCGKEYSNPKALQMHVRRTGHTSLPSQQQQQQQQPVQACVVDSAVMTASTSSGTQGDLAHEGCRSQGQETGTKALTTTATTSTSPMPQLLTMNAWTNIGSSFSNNAMVEQAAQTTQGDDEIDGDCMYGSGGIGDMDVLFLQDDFTQTPTTWSLCLASTQTDFEFNGGGFATCERAEVCASAGDEGCSSSSSGGGIVHPSTSNCSGNNDDMHRHKKRRADISNDGKITSGINNNTDWDMLNAHLHERDDDDSDNDLFPLAAVASSSGLLPLGLPLLLPQPLSPPPPAQMHVPPPSLCLPPFGKKSSATQMSASPLTAAAPPPSAPTPLSNFSSIGTGTETPLQTGGATSGSWADMLMAWPPVEEMERSATATKRRLTHETSTCTQTFLSADFGQQAVFSHRPLLAASQPAAAQAHASSQTELNRSDAATTLDDNA